MSVSTANEPAAARSVREAHSLAFRIAFAAAAGFTLGHVLGWDFPFLPPLFAVQLIAGSRSLSLQQALGFVVLMTAGCVFGILIAQVFVESPLVLILVLGLLTFLVFLMLARAQAVPMANIFLLTNSIVPLAAISSSEAAYGLVYTLIAGSILAVLLAFLAYAFFPSRGQTRGGGAAAVEEQPPVRAALANTAVLMSLVVLFLSTGSPVSVIVIVTAVTILRQPAFAGHAAAHAFVMGNVAGGLAATAAYLLVILLPSPAFLLLVTLFFGLAFGAKIAEGGKLAPVYTVGLVTFLIVLGMGLSPLPADSGAIFVSRVLTVFVAAAYTIGAASVLRALFHTR